MTSSCQVPNNSGTRTRLDLQGARTLNAELSRTVYYASVSLVSRPDLLVSECRAYSLNAGANPALATYNRARCRVAIGHRHNALQRNSFNGDKTDLAKHYP